MRIDMFVYNRCTTDARVLKEAGTLSEAGHDLRVVAVADGSAPLREDRAGFTIVRIVRNPIHYRLLKALRRLTGAARRGAKRTARAVEQGERIHRTRTQRLLLAPVALARWLGRPAWRAISGAVIEFEGLTRRALLLPHKPLMFLDYYWRGYRLIRKDPPQALHAHDLNTLPLAAALAWRFRLRLVYDAHELYPEISTLSPREARIWKAIEKLLARRADTVITVCGSIADEIASRNGIRRPTVLLNCPAAKPPPPASRSLLHERVGLPEDERIVLYQGGFAPHRGLEAVLRCAGSLQGAKIVLMGWGRTEDSLRDMAQREGLDGKVIFTEPVPREEVISYAAGATVGLIPYEPVGLNNTYTTPNKLFDYMAAGLPIAASRLPELVRFVDGGGIGRTFSPGDHEALAALLNGLLADEEQLAAMGERARAAADRYTWQQESAKLLSVYAAR